MIFPHVRRALLLCLLLILPQLSLAAPFSSCCGGITTDGQRLKSVIDNSDVQHLWKPYTHILWRSGLPDPHNSSPSTSTHCSAYAASIADQLGVYLLRPPEHSQQLLANAQAAWLARDGAALGWRVVDAVQAQKLANLGELVVAVWSNPNSQQPGHIAVIRPSLQSADSLAINGPAAAQAGKINSANTSIAKSFESHKGAWERDGSGTVRFYAHAINWSGLAN